MEQQGQEGIKRGGGGVGWVLGALAAGLVVFAGALLVMRMGAPGEEAMPEEAVAAPAVAEAPVSESDAVLLDEPESTYRVGPGEKYAKVSHVTKLLEAGDVVLVTGDIKDDFVLEASGYHDQPVVVRGLTRVENGRIIRPKVEVSGRGRGGIRVTGDWNVIEGLDISVAGPSENMRTPAIYYQCNDLVIRNCRIHHCGNGIRSWDGGNITVEYCEFDGNGVGGNSGDMYFGSLRQGTIARVEHCYIHDAVGGFFIKSRCGYNVIRYNWFEGSYHGMLKIINEHVETARRRKIESLRPMHSDVVGNVFHQGDTSGPRNDVMQVGGEEDVSAGTEGDFNIAHNLFVMTRAGGVPLLIHGNVDKVLLYNNAFVELGVGGMTLYERGITWDTAETRKFIERRGHGEPVFEGAGNWVSSRATGLLQELTETVFGWDPGFVDIAGGNYRPRGDSPLAGVGHTPLPKGRRVELVPEYEPVRGVPVDMRAPARRKADRPSVGPFEVEE